jgi:hypothetical protein
MMLSDRLVRMIEDHAAELTQALVEDLKSNARTASYNRLPLPAIRDRTYRVYKELGLWLNSKAESDIEANFTEVGKRRQTEGVPLGELVYALVLTKYHLRDYIRAAGLGNSAVELYQVQDLHRMLGSFFDKAIYYAVSGYERAANLRETTGVVHGAP